MTVKRALIHPASDHDPIAEAAAGEWDGHDNATSLSYSIKAPIHSGSVGPLV